MSDPSDAWVPAFEGQRPPFAPGHELSLRHGAYSDRVVAPLAKTIVAELIEDAPSWLHAVDAAAITAWAEAEARCQLLREYVAEHGMVTARGKVSNAADLLLRCERLSAQLRSRLGFDPVSRAMLRRDTAIGAAAAESAVERAKAAGRALREAREAAG